MDQSSLLVSSLVLVGVITYFFLYPRYQNDEKNPILQMVRANFAKLDPDYAKIPLRQGDSAYTENKEVITLCLIDPDTQQTYHINTIMYVALHELSHVISKSQGHGEEFRENFTKLLKRGAEVGIYDPRIPIPSSYCGVAAR